MREDQHCAATLKGGRNLPAVTEEKEITPETPSGELSRHEQEVPRRLESSRDCKNCWVWPFLKSFARPPSVSAAGVWTTRVAFYSRDGEILCGYVLWVDEFAIKLLIALCRCVP